MSEGNEADPMVRTLTALEEIGRKHQPSKLPGDYLRRYAPLLEPLRTSVSNVLEVGVEAGDSLRMWQEYFPNAVIHGVDIDPKAKSHEGPRIRVWTADSTDRNEIQRVIGGIRGAIQIVIDDGSHHAFDQIRTFKNLFPFLADGGLYLVEDVAGTRGPLRLRALRAFIELAEGINYWPKQLSAYQAPRMSFDTENYWIRNVVGVSFFRHLVVVEKGSNPGDNPYLETGSQLKSPRPQIQLQRLRELPWPWYRPRRHFVTRREVRPEGVVKLALRFLARQW